ncbi:UNVERIFIED_CONTAM: SnoaL-like protein [Acetivibrio alkalicellulosi]
MLTQLTQLEVNELVFKWYKKLDIHANVEELLPMVISEGLEMRFPEATLTSIEEFKNWYDVVINKFFDEIHTLSMVNIEIDEDQAKVKVIVNWQAKVWNPPDAKSKWLGFDAYQTWIVKRDPISKKAVIATYIVDELDPMEGSAQL